MNNKNLYVVFISIFIISLAGCETNTSASRNFLSLKQNEDLDLNSIVWVIGEAGDTNKVLILENNKGNRCWVNYPKLKDKSGPLDCLPIIGDCWLVNLDEKNNLQFIKLHSSGFKRDKSLVYESNLK